MRVEYTKRRQQVIAALTGIPGVTVLPPEGGFFAMVDVRGIDLPSNEIRMRLMREHDVVVVHGAAYGPAGEGTLRVSFASGGQALQSTETETRTSWLRSPPLLLSLSQVAGDEALKDTFPRPRLNSSIVGA